MSIRRCGFIVECCEQIGQGQGVTGFSDLVRCWWYFGQPLGQRVKIQSGAPHDDRALWSIQEWCDVTQPVPDGIIRIKGNMPVKRVSGQSQIMVIGPRRQDMPAIKDLQRIRIDDHTTLGLRDLQGQR